MSTLRLIGAITASAAIGACYMEDANVDTSDVAVSPKADSKAIVSQAAQRFPTYSALHEQAIARTCALNNGVCHNSKQFPDLRSATSMLENSIGRPCNVDTEKRSDYKDMCEPRGDHFRVTGTDVDEEILFSEALPSAALPGDISEVVLTLRKSIAAPTAGAEIRIERGSQSFTLTGARTTGVRGNQVTVKLGVEREQRVFMDDRSYPWHERMLRVADVNHNGTFDVSSTGPSSGLRTIVPGSPMKSYLLLRVLDPALGELMPLACRQWDDAATQALGCWIEGLKTNDQGNVTNAFEPINYAACSFNTEKRGRCVARPAAGLAGVEDVFTRTCGGSGCHIGEARPGGGLDLSKGKAFAALVGKPSSQVASNLVTPGSLDQSFLYCKVQPNCSTRVAARMPKESAGLSEEDLATLRSWIEAGAPAQ
jgi:hypothetical protein